MPLGKISKKQIKEGYKCLVEIQDLLEKKRRTSKQKNITSRFFKSILYFDST